MPAVLPEGWTPESDSCRAPHQYRFETSTGRGAFLTNDQRNQGPSCQDCAPVFERGGLLLLVPEGELLSSASRDNLVALCCHKGARATRCAIHCKTLAGGRSFQASRATRICRRRQRVAQDQLGARQSAPDWRRAAGYWARLELGRRLPGWLVNLFARKTRLPSAFQRRQASNSGRPRNRRSTVDALSCESLHKSPSHVES